jgi:hypothetical protein
VGKTIRNAGIERIMEIARIQGSNLTGRGVGFSHESSGGCAEIRSQIISAAITKTNTTAGR